MSQKQHNINVVFVSLSLLIQLCFVAIGAGGGNKIGVVGYRGASIPAMESIVAQNSCQL
jgi:hypothetical protein